MRIFYQSMSISLYFYLVPPYGTLSFNPDFPHRVDSENASSNEKLGVKNLAHQVPKNSFEPVREGANHVYVLPIFKCLPSLPLSVVRLT